MKNKLTILSLAFFAILAGCVNGDDYGTPDVSGECSDLNANVSLSTISISATSTLQQYSTTGNDIIEAYVTSSDEGGNFYKSISLVSVDGTKGFSIPIDAYNLYTKYEPGRKVFVKMNSLYFYNNSLTNSLEIGELLERGEPLEDQVGRLNGLTYENIVNKGCSKVDEETLVNRVSISTALNDSYLNKLIEFNGVQFSDSNIGKTYYDATNTAGSATNNIISDNTGNSVALRVSEFATFAGSIIPSLNGKIRGVLTKYNGEYQFMIRTLNDVNLTNPRFDSSPPIGGSAIVYDATLNEPFTSYTTSNQQIFPKYINDAAVGSRYWQVKTFSGNKYIQMSSFGGTPEANRSLFIVPVDMTAANTLSFKTKDGFNNGNVLKVYYTTNYIPGTQITNATLVDITSSFTIASGTTSGYATNFTNSGNYNIPVAVTGNGFFVFEYVGNGAGGSTTTMQIDDIVIN
jgi:hypothetical protein